MVSQIVESWLLWEVSLLLWSGILFCVFRIVQRAINKFAMRLGKPTKRSTENAASQSNVIYKLTCPGFFVQTQNEQNSGIAKSLWHRSKRRYSHVLKQTRLSSTLKRIWSDGRLKRRTCVEFNSRSTMQTIFNLNNNMRSEFKNSVQIEQWWLTFRCYNNMYRKQIQSHVFFFLFREFFFQ